MKLSTMLLPTGEFILIGSEIGLSEGRHDFPGKAVLDGLREQTGAASVLFTDQYVEVEDALFDEDARRATYDELDDEPEPDEEPGVKRRYYFPSVELPGSPGRHKVEFDVQLSDLNPDLLATLYGPGFVPTEGDINLTRAAMAGAEFSPAGLVSTRDLDVQARAGLGEFGMPGVSHDVDAEHVDLDAVLGEEPKMEAQVVTEVNPSSPPAGEFGRSPYTGPQEHVLDAADLTIASPEPWAPQVDDLVRIVGPSVYHGRQYINRQGRVVDLSRPGSALVAFPSDDFRSFYWLFNSENLELVSSDE